MVEGYGLTEATCLVSSAPLTGGGEYRLGSVGLPTFDTEVEIRSDDGAVLGPDERGELWVRGPQVTDGYLDHPEITAAQYVDGWLDTGDIAYLDDDGYLFICDRAKDMLIYKGYNVYPRELEEILVTHPSVSSAAVVGRDGRRVGQEPVAFVVPSWRRRGRRRGHGLRRRTGAAVQEDPRRRGRGRAADVGGRQDPEGAAAAVAGGGRLSVGFSPAAVITLGWPLARGDHAVVAPLLGVSGASRS